MKPFAPNAMPTLGVEQEFHLIDPTSGEMVPAMEQVRARLTGRVAESITDELFLSVIESRSAVAHTPDELVASISRDRADIANACQPVGVLLAAAGSHPFARWQDQQFVPSEHYRWVQEHHGCIAHRLLSFGLHIHVGMPSAEAAVYTMNEMRRWAGPLLALSVNSPFFGGAASGLASTRWHLFSAMPRTGMPPFFASFAELEALYEKHLAAGDITRPGDLWWALRPQPPLGTLEFRLFDLPTDVRRIGILAAICQAACETYRERFEAGTPCAELDTTYLQQTLWKAMRYDLTAGVIDPAGGEVLTMAEQVDRLLNLIEPKATELGAAAQIAQARALAARPSEAQWQLTEADRLGGDLRQLELAIARRSVAVESEAPAATTHTEGSTC